MTAAAWRVVGKGRLAADQRNGAAVGAAESAFATTASSHVLNFSAYLDLLRPSACSRSSIRSASAPSPADLRHGRCRHLRPQPHSRRSLHAAARCAGVEQQRKKLAAHRVRQRAGSHRHLAVRHDRAAAGSRGARRAPVRGRQRPAALAGRSRAVTRLLHVRSAIKQQT